MRIAIVRQATYPDDPRVRKQAESLAQAGHSVTVFCVKNSGAASVETIGGVHIRRLQCVRKRKWIGSYILHYGSFFWMAFFALSARQFTGGFQVVQTNTMPDFLVFASVVPKLAGARIVLDLHEAMPELFSSHFGVTAPWLISVLRFQERLSISFADAVITVSSTLAAVFRSRLPRQRDFHVVRNSPSERLFPLACPDDLNGVQGIAPPLIVCHGTIARRYGFQTLVTALNLLKERGICFLARIIGDGPEFDDVRALVSRERLTEQVELLGRIPFSEVPSHIRSAQLGIVPLDADSFTDLMQPNKLFEYVVLGVPAIASDLRGMREVFDDDEVLFFEPGDALSLADAIESVLRDYPSALERARCALRGANRWRWSSQFGSYRQALSC